MADGCYQCGLFKNTMENGYIISNGLPKILRLRTNVIKFINYTSIDNMGILSALNVKL